MAAKVFISCGQRPGAEIDTASEVETWLKGERYTTFLSIGAGSISDLNRRVFEELKSSDYFLFINFVREEFKSDSGPRNRGSLYTNQELAAALAFGFTDKLMILVSQKSVYEEGILGFFVNNTESFDTFDQVLPIIRNRIFAEGWSNSFSRHLTFENYQRATSPSDYADHQGSRRLFIGHIDVRNSRPDISAIDCALRLVKIRSCTGSERRSPDLSRLKVTGSQNRYQETIPPENFRTFDLFGIDANSPPDTYLLSESDIGRSPILSTSEKHILTYEISASGFRTVTKEIELDLSDRGPRADEWLSASVPGSGYPVFAKVISGPELYSGTASAKFQIPEASDGIVRPIPEKDSST
jgi:hypothetical protein